ncbi:DNA-processing protein DprA [Demequina sp. B12]|uniref:DNA-processing protein DprA n=1 Tax=Demequina sp. B12 TaxID=2992757 RepID=UPI00237AE357|nr:DNA-processing protein DprA [Demequina sp. B12]MDE0573411.1 DNA-processing protein DprA [Demequina sp. B12]
MTDKEERAALIAWSAIAEPGDATAGPLVDMLGPAAALRWWTRDHAALDALPAPVRDSLTARDVQELVQGVERWQRRLPHADAGVLEARAAACGARVVVRGSAEWPDALDALGPRTPFALWVRGDGDIHAALAAGVAVVGSRSATAYGEHMAADLASGIADARRAVISGGAYGIDARAHRAALAAGGVTVAVLAGGVDRLYPAGNADLLTQIVRDGAVMSEVPPGFAPHRSRFLQRNRIIAAASATVVVEAALRSGALSTARHALDLARPVAAVPGPVTSPASGGCHRMIRNQEAVLVTSASDVLELVEPVRDPCEQGELSLDNVCGVPDFAHPNDRAAYDACGGRGSDTDRVAKDAGLTAVDVLVSMGRLEMSGLVERVSGQWRHVRR